MAETDRKADVRAARSALLDVRDTALEAMVAGAEADDHEALAALDDHNTILVICTALLVAGDEELAEAFADRPGDQPMSDWAQAIVAARVSS